MVEPYNGYMVEGSSEKAILQILYENNLLKDSANIIENASGDKFYDKLNEHKYSNDFLAHDFEDQPITIHVLEDNYKRQLKFNNLNKNITVNYYITREEIEEVQLYFNDKWPDLFQKYKKNKCGKEAKPSAFFKDKQDGLGIKDIKKYDYVYAMWSPRVSDLVNALQKVKNSMQKRKSLIGLNVTGNTSRYFYLYDLINN